VGVLEHDPHKESDTIAENLILNAWKTLSDCTEAVKGLAFAVVLFFGSTYSCEQPFSSMKYIKSDLRSSLADETSVDCVALETTTYKPITGELCKDAQQQTCHQVHQRTTGLPEYREIAWPLYIGE
jgi:hypothetical protein